MTGTDLIAKEINEQDRSITFENIRYGMSVEVIDGSGYHSGCKVHFYNRKGVLIGNYYEFMPYERLRRRNKYKGKSTDWIRFFFEEPFEALKMKLFMPVLWCTDKLIRFTQKYMD